MIEDTFNRTEALAQFNKITGAFVMILQRLDISTLNNDFFLYKEIEIDIYKEKVIGTYDNFSIVSINDQPLEIYEDNLNALAREKILQKYPLEKQLTIIGTLLEKIADQNSIECDELKDMNDYITEVRRTNRVRKDFYSSDSEYQYVSTEEAERIFAEQREGGIMEYEPKIRNTSNL
jgi:hypothetical protein